LSHGDFEYHTKNLESVRKASKELGRNIGVLVDLPGPKLRINRFEKDSVIIKNGDSFIVDADFEGLGNKDIVGIAYKGLAKDCKEGDYLVLDDGNIELAIEKIDGNKILTKVMQGGKLSNNKGLNKKGGGLSAPAIGEYDKKILEFCAEREVDFVAISFVINEGDVKLVREINNTRNYYPLLISKIERSELVNNKQQLKDVVEASDGVMIARGDLAVEVGASELVGHQKEILAISISLDKFVIMATQMLESMTYAATPTRAEVSDVGNAVLDGVDAVMLSGETAVGEYPIETIKSMVSICIGNEKHVSLIKKYEKANSNIVDIDKAIAASAVHTANLMDSIGAIICFTESGATPRWMSRYLLNNMPILAITRNEFAYRSMSMLRNVKAYQIEYDSLHEFLSDGFNKYVEDLISNKILNITDKILISHGFPSNVIGYTNSMGIFSVKDIISGKISVI
jgi:pyruvate kinase